MCAASSSLPVPDSPASSTRASERATWVACSTTRRKAGLDPIMRGASPTSSRSRAFSCCERGLLQRVLEDQQQPVAAERLLEEVERARARGRHGVGDGRVPGDHDDRRVRALLRDAAAAGRCRCRRAGARPAGTRRRAAAAAAAEVGAAAADGHRVARALQHQPQRRADVLLVVHDHDRLRGHVRALFCSSETEDRQPERGAAQPSLDERRGRRRPAARSSAKWPGPVPCRAS